MADKTKAPAAHEPVNDVQKAWAQADAQTREAREKADAEARDRAAEQELEDEERKRQEEKNALHGAEHHEKHKGHKKHKKDDLDRAVPTDKPVRVQDHEPDVLKSQHEHEELAKHRENDEKHQDEKQHQGQRVQMGGPPNQSAEPKPQRSAENEDSHDQLRADIEAFEAEQRDWKGGWEAKKDEHGRLSPDDVLQHQKEAQERGRANYLKQQDFVERQMKLAALVREQGTSASYNTYEGRDHRNSHMGIDPDDGRAHMNVLSPLPMSGGTYPPRQEQTHSNIDAVDHFSGTPLRTPNSVPHKIETAPPPAARPLFQHEAAAVRVQAHPVTADITRTELQAPGPVLAHDHPRAPGMVNEPMSAMGRPADPRVIQGRPASLSAPEARGTATPEGGGQPYADLIRKKEQEAKEKAQKEKPKDEDKKEDKK